ncbi:lipopolysaccharide transport system ATP-binding protein [Nitrosomonas eutropha]|uniref:ABC transporter ATP-binding protein n=1 Tax=Nitrosomonas eutropha TaxID=916 RepID=UPI00089A2D0E|nr:ABC transporter ATP-binding protein [Nitrosomonas eutropha]SDW09955.1 lipopolysaccharide transport system ATP-binding protein [Nitrosomonas eutropha]
MNKEQNDIAIRVENLSKCYQIYDTPRDRLKQFILPRVHHLTGQTPRQYFREFWALKDISFDVKKGETIGIIGRNGSGKSTLLQLICGTLSPTSGSITTHGRIAALLELGSGFNPEFTGRENVYMNASVLGLSKEEIDQRFNDIAAFADIGEFIEQPVKTYSSGMMVRLAFAVIAHVDAGILVVDEALAVGDAFFTQKCMRFIRCFQNNGGTLLFVSHDTGAVVNLCSKAILLRQGQVIEAGSPKEVSERYLATLYEATQVVDGLSTNKISNHCDLEISLAEDRDMREALFNSSTLRNDIEIFGFNPDLAGFGTGEAKIQSVRLLDQDGASFSWVVGGEVVTLEIRCLAYQDLTSPIIGFQFKDRLGQTIFADNTYLVYQHNPQPVIRGGELVARFEFRLPVLPTGDYSIAVALADGSQDNHVQHHWLHEALIVRVHASAVCSGLVGIPMKSIKLLVKPGVNNER